MHADSSPRMTPWVQKWHLKSAKGASNSQVCVCTNLLNVILWTQCRILGLFGALGTGDSGGADSPNPPLTSLSLFFLSRSSTWKCRGKVECNFYASSDSERRTKAALRRFRAGRSFCVGVKCSWAHSPRRFARTRPAGLKQADRSKEKDPGEKLNHPDFSDVTHRRQGSLFFPECAATDLRSSSGVTKFGGSAQLSSAQHGDRLDSNPSGLCDQQSGGGSRGVAARDGLLEEGHAGATAGKTLGFKGNWHT